MFDVTIIGAGPAGTAAAYDLLHHGYKVLILDKYEFPRKKACAGGITPKCRNLFRYDISSVTQRVCNSVRVKPATGSPFLIQSKKQAPLCYMTNRKELDAFSLKKIIDKGAVFKKIPNIKYISNSSSSVQINTGNTVFKSRFLIGADGANSIVRRFLFKTLACRKQFAIEADIQVKNAGAFPMEFDFSQSIKGYYWIFPKRRHLNIGIYSTDSKRQLNLRMLSSYSNKRFGTDCLEAFKGYPICTHGFKDTPVLNNVLLAGDAAGMAEHLLGEGLYFAVKTGQLAAEAIYKSQTNGLPVAYLYSNFIKKIQFDLKLHRMASKWFYAYPGISLKTLSLPFIHKYFASGYAEGRPLVNILTNPAIISYFKN